MCAGRRRTAATRLVEEEGGQILEGSSTVVADRESGNADELHHEKGPRRLGRTRRGAGATRSYGRERKGGEGGADTGDGER
jgi:hypothetical protein